MNSVSPVLTEKEVPVEKVIALDQPQYFPIIVVRILHQGDNSLATYTRFRFSDKEREAISKGADLLLAQPHHGPLMPVALRLAMPDQYPLEEG